MSKLSLSFVPARAVGVRGTSSYMCLRTFGLVKLTLSRKRILAIRLKLLSSATTGKLYISIDRLHALWGDRQAHSPKIEMLATQLFVDPPNDWSTTG